jgi:hypothetical protein
MNALALLAPAAAAATFALSPSAQALPCKPGLTKINGQTARVFCGPARATLHVGGQTLHFSRGSCGTKDGVFTVNIGQELLPPAGGYPYFGAVRRGDSAAVSYRFGTLHDTVLGAKLVRRGAVWTFSGISLLERKLATGTFRCS